MPTVSDCPLCRTLLTAVLGETPCWRTALNTNQQLGQAIIVLKRHEESVAALTADEWIDLRSELIRMTTALDKAFQPDHYNYAFLQNQDRLCTSTSSLGMRPHAGLAGWCSPTPTILIITAFPAPSGQWTRR